MCDEPGDEPGPLISDGAEAIPASQLMNLTSAAKHMGCSRQYIGALVQGRHRAKNRPLKTITIDGVKYTTAAWIEAWESATSDKARHRPEKSMSGADVAKLMDRIEAMEARANRRGWSLFSDDDG